MENSQDRLARQIDFILELDRLKTVVRASYLLYEDRRENTALSGLSSVASRDGCGGSQLPELAEWWVAA